MSGSQKDDKIFKVYNKKTEIFDDSFIRQYKTYGDLSGLNALYYIQPKERDARMVAYYWLKALKEIK